jgi:hypothetical protein
MIDQHSPAWQTFKAQALRREVRRLRGLAAGDLPPIPYCHDWWWRDFVPEVLPAGKLTDGDVQFLLHMLTPHALARAAVGLWRSPELWATIYRLQYGGDAIRMFVGEALGRGEMPQQHALWLLLHPEQMPMDFPLYVRRLL